ncbi:MAG: hypothetical protein DLM50_02720 [Candidatus Meridianibacter frigidus]|nr:MAG: hypothetical protein DLM50_02720 [Candidatus Eremiobacteraeota bacterium]
MNRQTVNQASGVLPIVLSVAACALVLVALLTGEAASEKASGDEGTLAHVFQVLVLAELPFILIFIATADWRRISRIAGLLALQGVALMLAFAPVAFFRL